MMLTDKKAVLFDMDGTLIDSMNIWVKIDLIIAEKYGLVYPESLPRDIEGMSFTETAEYFQKHFLPDKTVEEIKTEWLEMAYTEYRDHIPYKKGAQAFLRYLQENGYKTAICTSNNRSLVDAMAARLTELGKMDHILTACDVKAGKPAPDVYLQAAKALGVQPQNCLVFEDIPKGILAGKNAGMQVCAVADDFSADLREEIRSLADYFIEDYAQVLSETFEIL